MLGVFQTRWWCPMCGADAAWGGTMMLGMTVFWLLVILAIAWLVLRTSRGEWGRTTPAPPESAEDILAARYARGEIDRDTFERMRADLRGP
jgi:putative membrane protein